MEQEKVLYGQTILEEEDLVDTSIDYLVELAYYKTNKKQELNMSKRKIFIKALVNQPDLEYNKVKEMII